MLRFSTKLIVSEELNDEKFISMVLSWISGSPHYSFNDIKWDDEEEYSVKSSDGSQKLQIYNKNGTIAVHLVNKDKNVIWTNDYILRNVNEKRILSVQLFSETENISDRFPNNFNRPYLLKEIIREGYGGIDNELKITDKFTLVDENNIDLIADVINQNKEYMMPIVYISTSFFNERCKLNCAELAKDLAGVAHVLVEKDHQTSICLKDFCSGKNPYNGAAEVYYGINCSSRIIPDYNENPNQFRSDVSNSVFSRLLFGKTDELFSWNKIILNELQLKNDSEHELVELSEQMLKDSESSLEASKEKIKDLEDEISNLKYKLQALEGNFSKGKKEGNNIYLKVQEIDFYDSELTDIVLKVLKKECESMSYDANQKERRKYHVLNSILQQNSISNKDKEIKESIKEAFGNEGKMNRKQKSTLKSVGFEITEGDHYKLTYNNDSRYQFTVARTSSDHRAKENLLSEINKKLFD